jgi:hypothetical protein
MGDAPAEVAAQEVLPAAVPEARPWRAGEAILDDTSLGDILTVVAFGVTDVESWTAIKDKLLARGCETVAGLEDWSIPELTELIRAVKPKKHPRSYIVGIGSATSAGTSSRRSE